eukprot:1136255-Pelagomonas_calceolata.AAC.2
MKVPCLQQQEQIHMFLHPLELGSTRSIHPKNENSDVLQLKLGGSAVRGMPSQGVQALRLKAEAKVYHAAPRLRFPEVIAKTLRV